MSRILWEFILTKVLRMGRLYITIHPRVRKILRKFIFLRVFRASGLYESLIQPQISTGVVTNNVYTHIYLSRMILAYLHYTLKAMLQFRYHGTFSISGQHYYWGFGKLSCFHQYSCWTHWKTSSRYYTKSSCRSYEWLLEWVIKENYWKCDSFNRFNSQYFAQEHLDPNCCSTSK